MSVKVNNQLKDFQVATVDYVFNRFISEGLKGWSQYIDKSTRDGQRQYRKLRADTVFIATPDYTHVNLASRWLQPSDRCKQIFIEKPLDSSLRFSLETLDLLCLGRRPRAKSSGGPLRHRWKTYLALVKEIYFAISRTSVRQLECQPQYSHG